MSGIGEQTHVRKAFAGVGDDTTLTRFVRVTPEKGLLRPKQWAIPGTERPNASIEAGRSIFHRKTVKPVAEVRNVLVSGHSNVKIGRDVRKGHLRGYWIYALSLEERATCPSSCEHWRSCYGNNMPWAKRVQHGADLEEALRVQVPALLGIKGRVGILVRLHALGDFYSVDYVRLWGELLDAHPRLAVYGYTARRKGTPIGDAIQELKLKHGRRFAVRWSNGGEERDCTVTIRAEPPAGSFACPEQTGKTLCCATCAACWATDKNVAFAEH